MPSHKFSVVIKMGVRDGFPDVEKSILAVQVELREGKKEGWRTESSDLNKEGIQACHQALLSAIITNIHYADKLDVACGVDFLNETIKELKEKAFASNMKLYQVPQKSNSFPED